MFAPKNRYSVISRLDQKVVEPTIRNAYLKLGIEDMEGGVLIVGQTRSGKTTLGRYIYELNKDKFTYVILICNSPSRDKDYTWIPEQRRFTYSAKVILKVIKKQLELQQQGIDAKCLLIFDDFQTDVDTTSNSKEAKLLKGLIGKFRHYGIIPFFLVQNLTGVGPYIRRNCNCLFASKIDGNSAKELNKLCGAFPDAMTAIRQCNLAKNKTFIGIVKSDGYPDYFYVKAPVPTIV